MLTRRQIRVKVLQAYYALLSSGNTAGDVFNQLLDPDYRELRSAMAKTPAEDGEDDAVFLRELYFGTHAHQQEYEDLVGSCLENWDLSRIAMIDRIILMLGIQEMLHCQTIPVKVTINEYLDIAKNYSTEKSSQFVNGILDKLHKQLKEANRIVKTGRGLIDPSPKPETPSLPA